LYRRRRKLSRRATRNVRPREPHISTRFSSNSSVPRLCLLTWLRARLSGWVVLFSFLFICVIPHFSSYYTFSHENLLHVTGSIMTNQMRPWRLRGAWFSCLLRHPTRRRSGSILSPGTHTGLVVRLVYLLLYLVYLFYVYRRGV